MFSLRRPTEYTSEEIAKHGSAQSLWLTVDGSVYDVTRFQAKHPGGAAVLRQLAGKDASVAMKAAHQTNRPRELMKEFVIGSVARRVAVEHVGNSGDLESEGSEGSSAGSPGANKSDKSPAGANEINEDSGQEHEEEELALPDAETAETVAQGAEDEEEKFEINTETFDELHLEDVAAAEELWRRFLQTAQTQEAAAEAIYVAIYEGAPALQPLFTTPKAVMAQRFLVGLQGVIQSAGDPARLRTVVETLGFNHLHFDVTVPKVIHVRDAILDLYAVELGDAMTAEGYIAWKRLLTYIGGAVIFVKEHYAERITILLQSWRQANNKKEDSKGRGSSQDVHEVVEVEHQEPKGGKFLSRNSKPATKAATTEEGGNGNNSTMPNHVPTNYHDMFQFNAAVMGFGDSKWMEEVLSCFHNIVVNVSNSARLQEECDFLSLRIAQCTNSQQTISWVEYKSCMLASLRSLLPKDWSTNHEVAWTWLWENVERLLKKNFGQPPVWQAALAKLMRGYEESQLYDICKDVLATFFAVCPAGQNFFKQSSTYLHSVMKQILGMTLDIFKDPVRMADEISALGLRHAGYGIDIEVFTPFVDAYVKVITATTKNQVSIQAFRWSLALIAKTLTRNISEGSTIVMKAINNNSARQVERAVSCAPRGERADWMLLVQVGTQDISPLDWALKSGSIDSAHAILKDLLTIRADRDAYYYGADELFGRHSDIVRKICFEAPVLLNVLFDGLIWRSRMVEDGRRRVNYYIKYLVVNPENKFDQAMEWITDLGDPKIVCHPIIVLLTDLIWSRVAYATFLFGKAWFVLTLIVFIVSQSVLHHLHDNPEGEGEDWERASIFGCRCFIYGCSLTQLLYMHMRKCIRSYRNGDVIRIWCIPVPDYIEDKMELGNFLLMGSLIAMLSMEPIIHCWGSDPDHMFVEYCAASKSLRTKYTISCMLAVLFYYILLIDLAVFSNRVSAFVLVCGQMMSEVGLFVLSLVGMTLAFASGISVVSKVPDFHGIEKGTAALLKMVLQTLKEEAYTQLHDEPVVLCVVFCFLVLTLVFLLNLLIAQLTSAYDSIYEDMVGFARLSRMRIIVETMPSVPRKRWNNFRETMRFDEKLEFNAGDVGVAGGVQIMEPAALNPTTVDAIKRYGGSTSPTMPWPEDDEGGDDEMNRYDRLEKYLTKAMRKMNAQSKRDKRGMNSSGGSENSSGSSKSASQSQGSSAGSQFG
mmetsp:Transcript_44684/g.103258  ORF Transcript_44684/g.103258 Transcript_44684/m.103258 type:complete len:1213 (-) Transcript_44684:53-3691(-)